MSNSASQYTVYSVNWYLLTSAECAQACDSVCKFKHLHHIVT